MRSTEEPEFYVNNMYSKTLENSKSDILKWEQIALLHLEGSEKRLLTGEGYIWNLMN